MAIFTVGLKLNWNSTFSPGDPLLNVKKYILKRSTVDVPNCTRMLRMGREPMWAMCPSRISLFVNNVPFLWEHQDNSQMSCRNTKQHFAKKLWHVDLDLANTVGIHIYRFIFWFQIEQRDMAAAETLRAAFTKVRLKVAWCSFDR